MSKIKVDTIAVLDDSSSVPTATLTALPARMTAAENGKAAKGANADITSLSALTTALSIAQGGTGGITPDAARSALGVIGRNRIINGSCIVAQRGSAAFGTGVGGYGGPDRFRAINSGVSGQFTQSQGTIVDGNVTKPAIVQTVDTATSTFSGVNYWAGVLQVIEGFNCFDLVGSPVAISFVFKTNVTGTFSVAVRDSTSTVSYNTSFAAVANVPVKVAINLPSIPVGAVIPASNASGITVAVGAINTGTYQAVNANVWNTGNYMTVPSSANWGATIGNYIALTDLQFEAGTVTPFERRSINHEMALCQRYFYRHSNGEPVTMGHYRASTTSASFVWSHPVAMRASPTYSVSAAAAYNVYGSAGAPLSGSQSAVTITSNVIRISVNTTAQISDSPAMLVLATSQWHDISAEL